LEGVLQHRGDVVSGILNGADDGDWNPAADPHLPAKYDAPTVAAGKAACKAALQRELGLAENPAAPLVGFVGRLTDQKGLDLIAEVIPRWVQSSDVQWALLGTGQPKYHRLLETLAERYPQKVAVRLEFSNPLAHRIEAGADMFLMPSRFEPCGLNQLYSLKYGTAPVVRSTGGLADTVVDCTPETLDKGAATGFSFEKYSAADLLATLKRALACYADRKTWLKLIKNGMGQNWSWDESARKYVKLYGLARNKAQSA
jgi:starch synthase